MKFVLSFDEPPSHNSLAQLVAARLLLHPGLGDRGHVISTFSNQQSAIINQQFQKLTLIPNCALVESVTTPSILPTGAWAVAGCGMRAIRVAIATVMM